MTKSGRATIAGYIAAYRAKGADTGVLGRQALLAPSALTRDQGSLPCHTALSPPTGGTRR